jgi:hypothetical protein
MKYLPLGLVLLFALSLCNLSEKFKTWKINKWFWYEFQFELWLGTSGGSAEHGEATPAQLAAACGWSGCEVGTPGNVVQSSRKLERK